MNSMLLLTLRAAAFFASAARASAAAEGAGKPCTAYAYWANKGCRTYSEYYAIFRREDPGERGGGRGEGRMGASWRDRPLVCGVRVCVCARVRRARVRCVGMGTARRDHPWCVCACTVCVRRCVRVCTCITARTCVQVVVLLLAAAAAVMEVLLVVVVVVVVVVALLLLLPPPLLLLRRRRRRLQRRWLLHLPLPPRPRLRLHVHRRCWRQAAQQHQVQLLRSLHGARLRSMPRSSTSTSSSRRVKHYVVARLAASWSSCKTLPKTGLAACLTPKFSRPPVPSRQAHGRSNHECTCSRLVLFG